MLLRVLNILTVRFAPNGITAFVTNYDRFMAQDAVRVDFVVPNEPSASARNEIEGRGGQVFILPQRNRNPLSYIRALAAIVRRGHYDVVHAHGNSATLFVDLLAAKFGGANVRIAHSHNTSCKQKLADFVLRPFFYRSYTNAMACSKAAGEWLFGCRPFTVVQNAVDTDMFAYDAGIRKTWRGKLGLGDAPTICHVGSLNAQKNHAFLLEAFARVLCVLPNAQLLLVGSGPNEEVVRRDVQKRSLEQNVHFIGSVESAAPYLFAADAFALPSLYEGLPFTLIEAQCAGLPCTVADTVTRDAVLSAQTVALPIVPNETAAAPAQRWAEHLIRVLQNPPDGAVRQQTSACAVQQAKDAGFCVRQNAPKLLALYEQYARGERGI